MATVEKSCAHQTCQKRSCECQLQQGATRYNSQSTEAGDFFVAIKSGRLCASTRTYWCKRNCDYWKIFNTGSVMLRYKRPNTRVIKRGLTHGMSDTAAYFTYMARDQDFSIFHSYTENKARSGLPRNTPNTLPYLVSTSISVK